MKNTANAHTRVGAKMLPFAGYNMPILYEGVNAEHETVRNAGVFDVSHENSLYGTKCFGFDPEK
jgi:aminomethyltransferase